MKRGIATFSSSPAEGRDGERIASDITQLVGWTPLVELRQVAQKDGVEARIVAKLEMYQPLSSIKERAALRMIEDAEEKGLITPGKTTLLELTSGNIGIALAAIGGQKGYKFCAVMPEYYSVERRIILKSLGADVVITDANLGIPGAVEKADQLRATLPHAYTLDQFSNAANVEAHFLGTGPEIWEDTAGEVDIFVCGSGSGGTISGAGKFLKSKNPSLKIICVEPAECPVISGKLAPRAYSQEENQEKSFDLNHELSGCVGGSPGRHEIQGFAPGFIPQNLDLALIDEVITVSSEEAMVQARRLAADEGLLAGISSGANLAASLKVAKREENKGKLIVTIFASGGERYLSTRLFEQVREECLNMKP